MAKCSTFEVLMAHVRRCREKASEMAPSEETKLLFAVDGWNSFESPLLWKQERVFIFLCSAIFLATSIYRLWKG